MDRTPIRQKFGLTSTPLQSVKRNIHFTASDGINISKPQSRKRKSFSQEISTESFCSTDLLPTNSNSVLDSFLDNKKRFSASSRRSNDGLSGTDDISSIYFKDSAISITNEDIKLTSSLEKCNLNSFDDNFDSQNNSKKCKWDSEELVCCRKSISAPGTPQHAEIDSDAYMKKYRSLEFTPTKATYFKIGTPERNEILYSQLVEVKPATKPKSPQKLRNELKRLSKPARKRLFMCRDFIYLFTKMVDQRAVIRNIFSYLNDCDLVNVYKVSTLWRNVLENDTVAYKRFKHFVKVSNISKENIPAVKRNVGNAFKSSNPTNIPQALSQNTSATEKWRKFAEVATNLSKCQRLTKCHICANPAITEKYFAQCTNRNCSYIWCNRCLSGSKTGPAGFICVCNESNSPPDSPDNRSKLANISNISNIDTFQLFPYEKSINTSYNTSSGYISHTELDKSLSFGDLKVKSTVLTNLNKNLNNSQTISTQENRVSSFHSVAEQCMKKRLHKPRSNEPNSPPKVNVPTIGSEQSKKNLRRLCR